LFVLLAIWCFDFAFNIDACFVSLSCGSRFCSLPSKTRSSSSSRRARSRATSTATEWRWSPRSWPSSRTHTRKRCRFVNACYFVTCMPRRPHASLHSKLQNTVLL
jgi:hypothetical protein